MDLCEKITMLEAFQQTTGNGETLNKFMMIISLLS
jgi:hypothetical protein